MRVLLVTNAPTPYRLPLFNELAAQLAREGITFRVVFGVALERGRRWRLSLGDVGFDYMTLESSSIGLSARIAAPATITYRGLSRAIREFGPRLVIVPGFSVATIKAWSWSLFHGTPYLIWSGSWGNRAGVGGALRVLQRRLLVRGAVGAIAYGSRAARYLEALGMPQEKVHVALNTVDTHFFRASTCAIRQAGEALSDRFVIVYIGYLRRSKNVIKLLEAVHCLAQIRPGVVLELIGDGDDVARLREYVALHRLSDVVRFRGYMQQSDLPGMLARAHCFAFQTDDDIWGLVLVEAMAAGVPCLASPNAGATHDLIRDGATGFVVDFDDTPSVIQKLEWLMDHPDLARRMGDQASRFIAERATLEHAAAVFVSAIRCALQR